MNNLLANFSSKLSRYQRQDMGSELFSWNANDHHPHKRGWLWITIFCLVTLGSAAVFLFVIKEWFVAVTFCVGALVYFLVHRKGDGEHVASIFTNGFGIDNQNFYHWRDFKGWFLVYDNSASLLIFVPKSTNKTNIILQMGDSTPEDFTQVLQSVDIPELSDATESIGDLWSRVLKL